MRSQTAFIGAIATAGMFAGPFLYNHRFNDAAFLISIIAFIGVPLIAGISQKQLHPPIALTAISLLLLCPIVYAVTDQLAAEFEKLRDGFFLATGSSIIFATSVWLSSSLRLRTYGQSVFAVLGLLTAIIAVVVLLCMVIYFE